MSNHGAAEVTHVNITTEVLLDYDSKNREFYFSVLSIVLCKVLDYHFYQFPLPVFRSFHSIDKRRSQAAFLQGMNARNGRSARGGNPVLQLGRVFFGFDQ